ncbi:MAG TPA: FAD-dependent oxidoreductase [Pyrinomonadaceae bacterium]|nr:FAD-dependent oxidoreductase [Pyrinomonadaceae bacterium]
MRAIEVVITGGGPAGTAAALSLRTHAPALSVALIESTAYDRPRVGEALPALARGLLEQLGVLQAFEDERHRPAPSAAASWGHPLPRENHFIYTTHGAGWHLDRARFDAFLAREARARGVEVRTRERVCAASRSEDGWRLRLLGGEELGARFVVDASGRSAAFARGAGARRLAFDSLVAHARFFTLDREPEPGTLIEAFAEGWWYTALAGERRVVMCLTDADIARRLGLGDEKRWLGLLSETSWIQRSVGRGVTQGPALTRAANSSRLEPVCAADWLAAGDAASTYDPLSSQGIVKSLRNGIFASYAVADCLLKSDASGLARYEKLARREFAAYARAHARYYAEERRWPESDFWHRRHRLFA